MKKSLILISLIFILASACQTEKKNSIIISQVKLVLETRAVLGEGAIWHPQLKKLYWIDIERGILNIYYPNTKTNKMISLGQKIGTVVPIDTGSVILALKNGIYTFNEQNHDLRIRCTPEDTLSFNRFNDGKCSPEGRFWVGSMSQVGKKKAGTLYKIEEDYSFKKMIHNVTTSNGIAWSLDGKKMYYIDTPTHKVIQYDYNIENGTITNPKTIIEIPEDLGAPDGSTIDADGKIWIAMWGGACVTRWDPENGKMLQKIDVPAKNVTSVAFGGEDLSTLYITTARIGTSNEDLEKYPNAGGLFSVKPGVAGIEAYMFKSGALLEKASE